MNAPKLINTYSFTDHSEKLFRVHSNECGLPSKIAELLKFENNEFSIRFSDTSILCVGHGSMLLWKYNCNKKATMSPCIEYPIPQCLSGYTAHQALVMGGCASIIVTNDGLVRYWPRLTMPSEYLDDKITNISNDECLLAELLLDGVAVAVFRSMKIVVIDLTRYNESGLLFKVFTQPRGFISGMSRYLSSLIVSPSSSVDNFKNIKVNNLLLEETELLIMANDRIDSLTLDVLFNGQYQTEIIANDFIKRAAFDALYKDKIIGDELSDLHLVFENFDLCRHLLYLLVQIQTKQLSKYVLVTYNRKLSAIDSIVSLDIKIVGKVELSVVVDESAERDEPCLLVAIKDQDNVYMVEVLTGIVKSHLNTEMQSPSQSIIGWTCPLLTKENPETVVVVLTAAKQLITLKHIVNAPAKRRMDSDMPDFNLSNASFSDMNVGKFSKLKPTGVSTPLTQYDPKGDGFVREMASIIWSESSIGAPDNDDSSSSEFRAFESGVAQFWLGYKSQAKRILGPLIERSQVTKDISLPTFVLEIGREIMDEFPAKDPRWRFVMNRFVYSNKSLLMPQQLQSKKEALQKLLIMLREMKVDVFGVLGNIAPMSVCQLLYMQKIGLSLPSYGDSQVTWTVGHCVGLCVELLEFVLVLNDNVNSENSDFMNEIMAKSCQHILALHRKVTPLDVITQEISLIPRFIRDCAEYINEKSTENVNSATSLAKMLAACLTASLLCRQQFEDTFLARNFHLHYSTLSVTTVAACWITEKQPIGVLDSLIDIIHRLLDLSRSGDYQLFTSTIDIVTVILDCFKYRLDWMQEYSSNPDELKRLRGIFGEIRSELIEKIVDDEGGVEIGLALADRFADFYWLTTICDILDNRTDTRGCCHLEPFLKKWSNDGLSEFVLDWYKNKLQDVNKHQHGKLLAKIQTILEKIQKIELTSASVRMDTSGNSHVIGKFLEKTEVQPTRWLYDIESGEFAKAALSLSRLGQTEKLSLSRRKTLFGLAKLSYLANTDLCIEETEEKIDTVNKYLKLIDFQNSIPRHILESELALSPDCNQQPVLEIAQLVRLILAPVTAGKEIDCVVQALELIDFVWFNRDGVCKIMDDEWQELLMQVWNQVIRLDDLTNTSMEFACQTSTIAKVLEKALDQGLSMNTLRPNLNLLFEEERLRGEPHATDVEFLVRGVFERMVGVSADDSDGDVVCVDDDDDMNDD